MDACELPGLGGVVERKAAAGIGEVCDEVLQCMYVCHVGGCECMDAWAEAWMYVSA